MKKLFMIEFKKYKQEFFTAIDDILRNPMIFDYQKTLLKLTIVLLVAVFFVIRGSTAPLIFDNDVIRFLFYSDPTGDKSVYNIAISVIAAYIFYIFQVYIPEQKKYKRSCSAFGEVHRHLIFLLNQYTLAWEKFLGEQPGKCRFVQFSYKLSPHNSYVLTRSAYEETIDALTDSFLMIINSPAFGDCDIAYQAFITNSYYVISGHLKFMDDQFPRWSDALIDANDHVNIQRMVMDNMKRIQRRLSSLENYRLRVIETGQYTGKSLLELLEDDHSFPQE